MSHDDDFDELAFWKAEAEFYRSKWSERLRSDNEAGERLAMLEADLRSTRADLVETMRELDRERHEHEQLWKVYNKRAGRPATRNKETA